MKLWHDSVLPRLLCSFFVAFLPVADRQHRARHQSFWWFSSDNPPPLSTHSAVLAFRAHFCRVFLNIVCWSPTIRPHKAPTQLVHCCIPVSLLIGGWDWVQGGNPLYAAVKCLSDRRGQIWRIFFHFFCKKHMSHPFPWWNFFCGVQKKILPPQMGHFLGGTDTFPKLRGRAVRGPLLYINLYALGST